MIENTVKANSLIRKIGHKLPMPIKVILSVGVLVLLFGMWTVLFKSRQYDVAAYLLFVGGGLALFIYSNHSGYRIAWDDDRVYMRNWGFRNLLFQRHPYHTMSYDEMSDIEGHSSSNPSPSETQFMPYQSLEISSRYPAVENISIYASGLNESGLVDFLSYLESKRPDIFSPEVRVGMRGDEFQN